MNLPTASLRRDDLALALFLLVPVSLLFALAFSLELTGRSVASRVPAAQAQAAPPASPAGAAGRARPQPPSILAGSAFTGAARAMHD